MRVLIQEQLILLNFAALQMKLALIYWLTWLILRVLSPQVIINLLENAIVHSKSTLPVELTVTADPRQASFHVKDYGIGISPDKLDSIFDGSCYDPDSSSDGHRGMGIGLSICKTIITAHNGEINAINHENGCEFIFTLPRNEETKA